MEDSPTITDNGQDQLIKDFYQKNAPDKVSQLTPDYLSALTDSYKGDNDGLIKDLYSKYAPQKVSQLTPDYLKEVKDSYGLTDQPQDKSALNSQGNAQEADMTAKNPYSVTETEPKNVIGMSAPDTGQMPVQDAVAAKEKADE